MHSRRATGIVVGIVLGLAIGAPAVRAQSDSPVISEMILHWDTHDRRADGSDNWPVTWSDDDHQYTSWGDGPGFDPNGDRMSLGFARVAGGKDNYQGINIWGGPFEGKSYGIISIEGILYAWWGPGSGRTSYGQTRMLISSDKGASWTQSSWDFTDVDEDLIMPTILNFGKDNAGARDSYVYHYFIRKEPVDSSGLGIHKGGNPATGKIDLARVPNDQLMDIGAYEFFAGLDGTGDPTWSSDAAQRVPVFEDSNGVGWNVSANYNAGLGRYMLMTAHTAHPAGMMGLFDAPEPWGPWTTIDYRDAAAPFGDGHVSDNTFFWTFSNKWASADGLDFVMIFTGINSNDTWNTVEGTFVLRNPDDTPPTVPGGLSATAQGEDRIDLSWSAASDPDSGVSSYRVYRDGVNVGQPTATSFSDTGLVEGTAYGYTVSAVNGAGGESAQTAAVSETTWADTTPPLLVSVAPTGPTQVAVVFSEPVEAGSATTASNYAIDNGVTVSSATLAADLLTVTLTTSTLSENVDYTLTVSNVLDRATSPNSIAANSTATFQFVNIVTFDQRIGSGADDVEEGQDGGMIPASSDLEMVDNSGDAQTVGLRYDLAVPQGATIVNAYVQFQVDESTTGAASLSIEAHASDDAPVFGGLSHDLTSRPRTSASTAWAPAPWPTVGEQGADQRTPNIAPVLQEIVNRPGWASGNSLVLIVSGSGTRIAEAYNGDSTAAALLHVDYAPLSTTADPPAPPENPQVH